jgi:hypothetical protein
MIMDRTSIIKNALAEGLNLAKKNNAGKCAIYKTTDPTILITRVQCSMLDKLMGVQFVHYSIDRKIFHTQYSKEQIDGVMKALMKEGLNLPKNKSPRIEAANVGDYLFCKLDVPIDDSDPTAIEFTHWFIAGSYYEILAINDTPYAEKVIYIQDETYNVNEITANPNTMWTIGATTKEIFDVYRPTQNMKEGLNLPKKERKKTEMDFDTVPENVWDWDQAAFEIFKEHGTFEGGHWVWFKVNDNEYEATRDGLYMDIYSSFEDMMLRQNIIDSYVYDGELSDENGEETFVNDIGVTRLNEGLNLQKKYIPPLTRAEIGDSLYCKDLYPGISMRDLKRDDDIWEVFREDFTVGRTYPIVDIEELGNGTPFSIKVMNNKGGKHGIPTDDEDNWGFGFKSSDFFDLIKRSDNIQEGLNLVKLSKRPLSDVKVGDFVRCDRPFIDARMNERFTVGQKYEVVSVAKNYSHFSVHVFGGISNWVALYFNTPFTEKGWEDDTTVEDHFTLLPSVVNEGLNLPQKIEYKVRNAFQNIYMSTPYNCSLNDGDFPRKLSLLIYGQFDIKEFYKEDDSLEDLVLVVSWAASNPDFLGFSVSGEGSPFLSSRLSIRLQDVEDIKDKKIEAVILQYVEDNAKMVKDAMVEWSSKNRVATLNTTFLPLIKLDLNKWDSSLSPRNVLFSSANPNIPEFDHERYNDFINELAVEYFNAYLVPMITDIKFETEGDEATKITNISDVYVDNDVLYFTLNFDRNYITLEDTVYYETKEGTMNSSFMPELEAYLGDFDWTLSNIYPDNTSDVTYGLRKHKTAPISIAVLILYYLVESQGPDVIDTLQSDFVTFVKDRLANHSDNFLFEGLNLTKKSETYTEKCYKQTSAGTNMYRWTEIPCDKINKLKKWCKRKFNGFGVLVGEEDYSGYIKTGKPHTEQPDFDNVIRMVYESPTTGERWTEDLAVMADVKKQMLSTINEGLNLHKKTNLPFSNAEKGDILICTEHIPGYGFRPGNRYEVLGVGTKDYSLGLTVPVLYVRNDYGEEVPMASDGRDWWYKKGFTGIFPSEEFFSLFKMSKDISEGLNLPKKVFDPWEMIRKINWKNSYRKAAVNWNGARDQIRKIYNDEDIKNLATFVYDKMEELKIKLFAYGGGSYVGYGLTDTGMNDLCSHIVGLGKAEFDAVMANPELAKERATNGWFAQDFQYLLDSTSAF